MSQLDSLQVLALLNCRSLNDDALQCLAGMKSLRRLEVAGTPVTKAGAKRLNQGMKPKPIVVQGYFWKEP